MLLILILQDDHFVNENVRPSFSLGHKEAIVIKVLKANQIPPIEATFLSDTLATC